MVVTAVLLAAAVGSAGAQPTFGDVTSVPADAESALTMSVPHERDAAHNTRVVITLPAGWDAVACLTKPTWTCALVESDRKASFAFTKDEGAAPAEDEIFGFTVHSPTHAGTFAFATRQVYSDATVVTWPGPILETSVPASTPAPTPTPTPTPDPTVTVGPVPPVTPRPTPSPSPRPPKAAPSRTSVPPTGDVPPSPVPETSSPRVVALPGAAPVPGGLVGPLARGTLPAATVPAVRVSPSPSASATELPDLGDGDGDGDGDGVIGDVDTVAAGTEEPGLSMRVGMGALAILLLGASTATVVYLRRRASEL